MNANQRHTADPHLPWRESTHAERLDRDNGLLLTANLDALFDVPARVGPWQRHADFRTTKKVCDLSMSTA